MSEIREFPVRKENKSIYKCKLDENIHFCVKCGSFVLSKF